MCVGIASYFFNEIHLLIFYPFFKLNDVFVKVTPNIFIIVHNWINIMVKMVKPQGVPYKMLRGNPYSFETHN
jgi:hypothetical protein